MCVCVVCELVVALEVVECDQWNKTSTAARTDRALPRRGRLDGSSPDGEDAGTASVNRQHKRGPKVRENETTEHAQNRTKGCHSYEAARGRTFIACGWLGRAGSAVDAAFLLLAALHVAGAVVAVIHAVVRLSTAASPLTTRCGST